MPVVWGSPLPEVDQRKLCDRQLAQFIEGETVFITRFFSRIIARFKREPQLTIPQIPAKARNAWSHLHRDIEVFNGVKPLQYIKAHGTTQQYNAAKRAANDGDGSTVKAIAAQVYRNK